MFDWLQRLLAPSETVLSEVAQVPATAEAITRELQRVRQDNFELRAEWSEVLDKLTALQNRANARLRGRARLALDREEIEEEEEGPAPVPRLVPPPPPELPPVFDPRDKASLRRMLALRAAQQNGR